MLDNTSMPCFCPTAKHDKLIDCLWDKYQEDVTAAFESRSIPSETESRFAMFHGFGMGVLFLASMRERYPGMPEDAYHRLATVATEQIAQELQDMTEQPTSAPEN